jgi:hypothetical protein
MLFSFVDELGARSFSSIRSSKCSTISAAALCAAFLLTVWQRGVQKQQEHIRS